MLWLLIAAALSQASGGESPPAGRPSPTRYGFYRDVLAAGGAGTGGSRRVFGGEPASAAVFPAACRLIDRSGSTLCSGTVLAPRWVLTAAHCISGRLAYVKYNARNAGDFAAVHFSYRHPAYKVIHEDEGHGEDVTLLHHDVGLVRTRTDMILATPPDADPLIFMRMYNIMDLQSQEVEVLGFGSTEEKERQELLFVARLRLAPCGRGSWLHCACGAAPGAGSARGVCAGDSGGPVLYRGRQVGVTSMGPLSCASALPAEDATSVFTELYYYVDLVNATMRDADHEPRMTRFNSGCELRAVLLTVFLAACVTAPLASTSAALLAVLLITPISTLLPVFAELEFLFAR